MRCVHCMSEDVSIQKFTDVTDAGVVSVMATIEIPVCESCRKAARPWWIAFGSLFGVFLLAGIPFAIAQDKHMDIPKVIPILMFVPFIASLICLMVARRREPVRLVPNKIDRENLRIKFRNAEYAEAFIQANSDSAKIINPWKYG